MGKALWLGTASAIGFLLSTTSALAQSAGTDPTGAGVAGAQGTPPPQGTQVETPVPSAESGSIDQSGIGDIIVTAQKRSESANTVPISINVASGAELAARGVSSAADLSKIVPGFSFTQTQFGPPVYTLRGIGFYDSSIGAKPSVSVYLDEVPIPFSIMTRGSSFDLERVEVLKGPQGTLFGQNATGGAINYIAAKPTREFKAGLDVGYAQYDLLTAGGFVSGPLSSTLSARIAVKTEQGGAYQRSVTRPGDENGKRNFTTGRFLLDWKPSDAARFELGLNGFLDRSETQTGQLIAVNPLTPGLLPAAVLAAPLAGRNNRDSDWTPGQPRSSDEYYQAYLRGDVDLLPDLSLTSITSYSRYNPDFTIDADATAASVYSPRTTGYIAAFNQELRVAGKVGNAIDFIVGGNYSRERTYQRDDVDITASSSAPLFFALGIGPVFPTLFNFSYQRIESYAGFGNVDLHLTDQLTVHGGVRYTKTSIDYAGCSGDRDGNLATAIGNFYNFVVRPSAGLPPAAALARGSCVTLRTDPTNPSTFLTGGQVDDSLDEDNVSWRAGLDYKPRPGLLLYASASKGYKSGSFPTLPGNDAAQFRPVTQESVMAYEAGIKASVLDRRAQINAAVFHYDYDDKQVRGRTLANPNIFGPLERLLNVPKVKIDGGEIQLDLLPVDGFRVSLAGTYIHSKISDSFIAIDAFGATRDFRGESLPLTPEFQFTADVQYDFDISERVAGFVGGNLEFHSKTNSTLGEIALYEIKDYALVDLRAGLKLDDNRYQLSIFARNLFDEFYFTNATRVSDTSVRFAGRPRTIGATLSFRY